MLPLHHSRNELIGFSFTPSHTLYASESTVLACCLECVDAQGVGGRAPSHRDHCVAPQLDGTGEAPSRLNLGSFGGDSGLRWASCKHRQNDKDPHHFLSVSELVTGVEPATFGVQNRCTSVVLHQRGSGGRNRTLIAGTKTLRPTIGRHPNGAPRGNRTLISGLRNRCSSIEARGAESRAGS